MDYQEEQNGELEALDSIYCGELEVLSRENPIKFQIPVKSEAYDVDEGTGYACILKFTYTPKYPDEIPEIEVDELEHLEEDEAESLIAHLKEEAGNVLGVVMIFTLVSSAQEWLSTLWDNKKKYEEEEREKRIKAEEEAEQKRFEGTIVTPETFYAWKEKFELEFASVKKANKEKDTGKLTGKEMFMNDNTLIQSDLKFLNDLDVGGDNSKFDDDDEAVDVEVDEDLFKDMDELDIGSEELSD